MLGKKLSDEAKAKMSAAKIGKTSPTKGKKLSDEHKAKISAAKIGKKLSDEAKDRMSAAKKGIKHSDEHKAKLSAAQKKKAVYCVELDKVFAGINIAAQELSLFPCNISLCCQGKRKTCGGFHFEFHIGVQK